MSPISIFSPTAMFPQLLTYGLLAPVLLRIAVGIFIIYLGKDYYKKTLSWVSIIYIISGALLILGLYTQITAIISSILIMLDFYTNKKDLQNPRKEKALYIITILILLSLLFTGPGLFAFDLPL